MTATIEEALEQGWHLPTPTFFGKNQDDVMVHAGKCHQSPWVLMRRTEPKPVLIEDRIEVQHALRHFGSVDKIPSPLFLVLPKFWPRPRPVTFSYFPEYRR